jgi:processive 1,2-diacylglycerol beta-glucosyltransferase
MSPPRTAILSYALGTGHKRVGEILASGLAERGHSCDHRPLETWVPWEYDLLFRHGYLLAVLKLTAVWEAMYNSPRFAKREALGLAGMRPRAWKRFGKVGLGEYDLVVATQYNAMEVAADWKKFTGKPLKLAAVLTDYDVYPLWGRPEVDLFLVPHDDLKMVLVDLGVPEAKIAACGIPIDGVFETPRDGSAAKASLGLDPETPTVLVIGGGVGAGPIRASVRAALASGGWNVMAVCGHNEKLLRSLVPDAQAHPERLRVLGYRTDIPDLMAASDVIVTKGGGLSLSEALYSGARVVVVPSLPGQERANTRFMAERGWVEVCEVPARLAGILNEGPPAERRPCPLMPAPAAAAARLLDELARREE